MTRNVAFNTSTSVCKLFRLDLVILFAKEHSGSQKSMMHKLSGCKRGIKSVNKKGRVMSEPVTASAPMMNVTKEDLSVGKVVGRIFKQCFTAERNTILCNGL